MSIVVTPIPSTIEFSAPAFSLGTTNTAGAAATAVSSNSTLLTYDATVPTTIAYSATAAAGAAAVSARRDHTHGMVADAFGSGATEAEMVTPASTTVVVTPGIAKYHPGVAKVWCQVQADGSSLDSYNVTSTAQDSTGLYTVTVADDLANGNYVGAATSNSSVCKVVNINNINPGTFQVEVVTVSEGAINSSLGCVIFGVEA